MDPGLPEMYIKFLQKKNVLVHKCTHLSDGRIWEFRWAGENEKYGSVGSDVVRLIYKMEKQLGRAWTKE